jgi:carbon storage regulator CsrA
MLVLSRRLHQKIVLPGLGITIQITAVKAGTVRLGVQTPPQVRIVREELLQPPARAAGR